MEAFTANIGAFQSGLERDLPWALSLDGAGTKVTAPATLDRMEIHHEPLSQIESFISNYGNEDLNSADKRLQYQNYLKMLRPYVDLGPSIRMLEIGTGTGWFPVMCKLDGLTCKGLEISQDLAGPRPQTRPPIRRGRGHPTRQH